MRVAPYWVREKHSIGGVEYRLRAYSFRSMAEARERMEQKVRALGRFRSAATAENVEALRAEMRRIDEQPAAGEYDVVALEPILSRVDEHNIITRNHYGAEVLNSDDTCFLDVDAFGPGFAEWVLGLFSRRRSDEERLLHAVQRLCADSPGTAVRAYRTARGWRLIVAAAGLAPDSPLMRELSARLHVDPMYAGLCRRQRCWRARLTPKPVRLGMPGFPRAADSESAPAAAADWVELYAEKSRGVATCRLLDTFGPHLDSPAITLHDSTTGALIPDLPLK